MATSYPNSTTSLTAATTATNGDAVSVARTEVITAYISITGGPTTVDVTVEISRDGTNYSVYQTDTKTANEEYVINLGRISANTVRINTSTQTGGTVTGVINGSSTR